MALATRQLRWCLITMEVFVLALLVVVRVAHPAEVETHPADAPLVKVLTPVNGYLMGASSETKLLVALEITDGGGAGIDTDDVGMPRFVEPNKNVSAFASRIEARGTYTDHLGRTVVQLVALIPARELETSDKLRITPPIDGKNLALQARKEGFPVPRSAWVQLALFNFRVKDKNGVLSEALTPAGDFQIGYASSLYLPAPEPRESEKGDEK